MADKLSDADLVRRFQAGDRAAFGALAARHEQRVYNIAFRMLGRPEDARDAAQDAFLSAMRALGKFRGESAFTTWLHRITVNACYDSIRKTKRLRLADDPGAKEHAEQGPPSPDHADTAAGAIDVQRALIQVPEDFRAVLVLHDIQDLQYEEIARVLEIPVGTVKSRLHRGRVALAGFLRGTTGDPATSKDSMTP